MRLDINTGSSRGFEPKPACQQLRPSVQVSNTLNCDWTRGEVNTRVFGVEDDLVSWQKPL